MTVVPCGPCRRSSVPGFRRICTVLAVALACLACEPSTPHSAGPPLELLVEPDLVVGGAESGPQSFSRISDIAVDGWGRILIADVVEAQIRLFDSTGAFVRAVGRRGSGPGEFNSPLGLSIDHAGNLTVYDPLQRRVSVFDSAGKVVRQHIIPISSWSYKWDGGIDSLGRLVDWQSRARPDTGFHQYTRVLDLTTGHDTLFEYPTCGFPVPAEFHHAFGIAGIPFAAGRVTSIDARRGGTWCAHSGAATAYFVPFGKLAPTDSFVSRAVPERVTAEERAAAIANLERQVPNLMAAGFDPRQIPDVKPLVTGFASDDAGRLWLELQDSVGAAYHVFSASGEWIARVRTSTASTLGREVKVRGDRLYVIAKDSLDVPMVVRFKVTIPQ